VNAGDANSGLLDDYKLTRFLTPTVCRCARGCSIAERSILPAPSWRWQDGRIGHLSLSTKAGQARTRYASRRLQDRGAHPLQRYGHARAGHVASPSDATPMDATPRRGSSVSTSGSGVLSLCDRSPTGGSL